MGDKSKEAWEVFGNGIIIWVLTFLFSLLWALVAGWCWDSIRPVFNLPPVSYWQMFSLLFIVRLFWPHTFVRTKPLRGNE